MAPQPKEDKKKTQTYHISSLLAWLRFSLPAFVLHLELCPSLCVVVCVVVAKPLLALLLFVGALLVVWLVFTLLEKKVVDPRTRPVGYFFAPPEEWERKLYIVAFGFAWQVANQSITTPRKREGFSITLEEQFKYLRKLSNTF